MARQLHLVIASYRENLEWLQLEPPPCSFTLMNSSGDGAKWWNQTNLGPEGGLSFIKSGSLPSVACENVGKEAGQYLSYIIAHYDRLPDRMVFCQADLGPRVFTTHRTMNNWSSVLKETLLHIRDSDRPVGVLGSFLEPLPERVVPFPPKDNRVFKAVLPSNKEWPKYTVAGHVGAQFWVDKELVKKFPVSYYKNIYDLRGMLAWDLEYVWPSVFQPEVVPPAPPEPEPKPKKEDSK